MRRTLPSCFMFQGAVIFFCYILCSETPVKQLLITRLKDENAEKQSPDAGKHLKCEYHLARRDFIAINKSFFLQHVASRFGRY